jgi:hypothetical protein
MARTHAATPRPEYGDGGVLLGKGGEPIPTTPTRGVSTLTPHIQHMDDGEIVAPPPKAEPAARIEYEYICNSTTWQRNMDGFQALHLLNAMMGGLSVTLDHAALSKLPPDVRWHFKQKVKQPDPEAA